MLQREKLIPKLQKLKAKRVYLQVPEGLKMQVLAVSNELKGAGFSVFISVDPCFGACDIRDREAKALGCDVLVHLGHSDFGIKPEIPVIYEEYRIDFDPVPLLKAKLSELKKYDKIGLVTTIQYIDSLEKAKGYLKAEGKDVFIGKPSRAKYPGQTLGCDYSAAKQVEAKVDCFLFLGTGGFHPIGLAMELEKPVLFLDFETTELVNLEKEKFNQEKLRYARIAKASEARNFGIIVSTKPGQCHPRLAEKTAEKLESLGRSSWILVADQITPDKILGLQIEALINTACPRIREDSKQFGKPIISPEDIDHFPEC